MESTQDIARGVPVFSKDYVGGKKHGTHLFWFPSPVDPDDYKTKERGLYFFGWR